MPLYDCGAPDCEECQSAFGPDRKKAIATYKAREKYYSRLEAKTNSEPFPHDEDVFTYNDFERSIRQ